MIDIISIYKALKEVLQFFVLLITIYTFVDVQKQKRKKKQKKVSPKKRRNF